MEDEKHWSETLVYRVSSRTSLPKYQLLLFLNFGLKWMLAGMILFSLNFFYITPEFACTSGELVPGLTCEQFVCGLTQQEWLAHLKQPVPRSIALDYGTVMLCGNKWLASVLQSMSYIGSLVGYLVMSHIADNFGRKLTERAAWAINIVGMTLLVTSGNLAMVGLGSFLMGLGTNSAITLHYTFMKELLVGKMRQRSFLIVQVLFSIGVSLIALLSMFIPNWKIIAGFFMLLPALLMVPYSIWVIEETPNFSLKKGRLQLLHSLNKIASINSTDNLCMQDLQFIPDSESEELPSQGAQYSLIDLFRYRSLFYITIACGAMNLIIEFVYDGTILSLDKIGINVYLDQILVGFVEIFAAIFCSWVVVKVNRNIFLRVCLVLVACFTAIIGVLTLLFEHEDNQINAHVIAEMVILGMLRFVLASMWGLFFVYVAELYPSNVLSLAFGYVSAVGTIGASVSPYIRLVTANATMFIMSGISIGCYLMIRGLRETKGQKAVQQIEERAEGIGNKKSVATQKSV